MTNAELAAVLHLSQGTVRNYLSTAIQKLAVRNRAGEGLAVTTTVS